MQLAFLRDKFFVQEKLIIVHDFEIEVDRIGSVQTWNQLLQQFWSNLQKPTFKNYFELSKVANCNQYQQKWHPIIGTLSSYMLELTLF